MNMFTRNLKTPSFRMNPTSIPNDTLTFDHAEEQDGTTYYYPKETYMQKHAIIENNELQRSLREALMEYERQNKPMKRFKCRPITIKRENNEPQTQVRCYEESTTSETVPRDRETSSTLSSKENELQQPEQVVTTVSFGKKHKHKHKNKKHHDHHSYYYADDIFRTVQKYLR